MVEWVVARSQRRWWADGRGGGGQMSAEVVGKCQRRWWSDVSAGSGQMSEEVVAR